MTSPQAIAWQRRKRVEAAIGRARDSIGDAAPKAVWVHDVCDALSRRNGDMRCDAAMACLDDAISQCDSASRALANAAAELREAKAQALAKRCVSARKEEAA